jgi:pyruvate kinase
MMKKRTKILVTIGPASNTPEMIEKLMQAGANLFRLNFSHGSHDAHLEILSIIRATSKRLHKTVGILQDISGPKVRIGEIERPFELKKGDRLTFVSKEIVGYQESEHAYTVSINYPKILERIKVDEYIYLYDGTIRAKVIAIGESVEVVVENHGILSSKKGVNFPNTEIGIDILTQKDRDDIAWGIKHKVDIFAISFVQNANDIKRVRKLLGEYEGKIIAKIEKFDAIEHIDAILKASDGLMVARGDLGIEVPFYEVPTLQKMLIRKANESAKPIITATQMLLSMTKSQNATRAEVSDVANAVLDGTDIVMLSEESAIGDDPIHVVETMHNIIRETEKIYPFRRKEIWKSYDKNDIIERSVVNIADKLGATGILSLTSSGWSTVKISRFRPATKVYAFAHKRKLLNQLSALWGVMPIAKIPVLPPSKMIQAMLVELDKVGKLDKQGLYITTIGYPAGVPGSTNTIKILNASEIAHYLKLK